MFKCWKWRKMHQSGNDYNISAYLWSNEANMILPGEMRDCQLEPLNILYINLCVQKQIVNVYGYHKPLRLNHDLEVFDRGER